jgi:hypothetical protein
MPDPRRAGVAGIPEVEVFMCITHDAEVLLELRGDGERSFFASAALASSSAAWASCRLVINAAIAATIDFRCIVYSPC